jgi:hypothetical protein
MLCNCTSFMIHSRCTDVVIFTPPLLSPTCVGEFLFPLHCADVCASRYAAVISCLTCRVIGKCIGDDFMAWDVEHAVGNFVQLDQCIALTSPPWPRHKGNEFHEFYFGISWWDITRRLMGRGGRLLNSGGGKIRIVNSKCGSTLFLRYEKRHYKGVCSTGIQGQ